jgi:hypothetical protein
MTPKEQYEARKADRNKRREAKEVLDESDKDIELLETLDRMATAFERIAEAMETAK